MSNIEEDENEYQKEVQKNFVNANNSKIQSFH